MFFQKRAFFSTKEKKNWIKIHDNTTKHTERRNGFVKFASCCQDILWTRWLLVLGNFISIGAWLCHAADYQLLLFLCDYACHIVFFICNFIIIYFS